MIQTISTKITSLIFLAFLLAGCLDNPTGMTTRTEIRAQAHIEAARLEADAAKHAANQATIRTSLVVAILPWLALIVMGGIVAAIVVWWQGRIAHTQTLLAGQPLQPPRSPRLADLKRMAHRQGYQIEIENQVAYLVDCNGRQIGQRALPGGTHDTQ